MPVKKVFLTIFVALALVLPAFSEVTIEDLNVRRKGGNANIRVVVMNPGNTRQAGPVMIDVFVRQNATQEWTKIKTWDNISMIQPHYRVARDFFDENNATLASLAYQGAFEVRAVVRLPGGVRDVEAVRSWSDKE